MTEFENNYFDFESADNFLDSISGTLNNLSPSSVSGDESVRNNGTISNVGDIMSWDADSGNEFIKQEYINPNIKNLPIAGYTGPNDFSGDSNNAFIDGQAGDIYSNDQPHHPGMFSNNSTTMSTTSYSQDSNSNGISPTNQNSVSSTHTSPESIKEEQKSLYEDPLDKQSAVSSRKSSKVSKPKSKDKTSHNVIEKKYRTNINSKILMLRDAVPSLRIAAGSKDVSLADLEGLTPASKLNKASVLTKATEYIKHLEGKNEILRQQNLQLQKLLQEADQNPQNQNQNQNQNQFQFQQQQQPQAGGFGYYPPPSEQSFNSTPIQQSYSANSQVGFTPASAPQQVQYQDQIQQSQQYPQQTNNKFLLGGMATVMATSLFSGTNSNDFKGMSALPFSFLLPRTLTHPSPLTIQIWGLVKVLLVLGSFASIFLPKLQKYLKKEDDKTRVENVEPSENLFRNWLLVSLGFQLPLKLDDNRKNQILRRLEGKTPHSGLWGQILKDYWLLSVSDVTFENCFLNLLLGKLLINKYPLISKIINHNLSLKASLILNLDYKGDNESLQKLNTLIGKIDGLSMFGSDNFLTRLSNLLEGKRVNVNVVDSQNNVKYVELLNSSSQTGSPAIYDVIVNWRVLEIAHQLSLAYLTNITKKTDSKQIKADIQKIEACLLESYKSSKIYDHFKLFKTVVSTENSQALLRDVHGEVSQKLREFKGIVDSSIDDDLFIEDDDSESSQEDESETEAAAPKERNTSESTLKTPTQELQSQKSLISSLNLVNDEKFIILATSLALYYFKNEQKENATKILGYLNLEESSSLSLLSFTSVVKLLNVIIPGIEENDTLDKLVKITRGWLNTSGASKSMGFELRSGLTELIVQKGMLLNGIEADVEEES